MSLTVRASLEITLDGDRHTHTSMDIATTRLSWPRADSVKKKPIQQQAFVLFSFYLSYRWLEKIRVKNSAYGSHWISWLVQIVEPIKKNPPKNKFIYEEKLYLFIFLSISCQVSGVRCHASCVTFCVTRVSCHLSHVTNSNSHRYFPY